MLRSDQKIRLSRGRFVEHIRTFLYSAAKDRVHLLLSKLSQEISVSRRLLAQVT